MKRTCLRILASVGCAMLLCGSSLALAQTAPDLGAAARFAVLGGSAVTNTGSSNVTGDLGLSPGTAVSGFPPGLVTGTIHVADAVALAAQNAVTTAYNDLASQSCTQDLTGQDLGGMTLVPGVYCFSTSAGLTGTLTLDAGGDAGAVWVFRIGSTLTTASGSAVVVSNGGSPCNVFWQVGSSATLGTTTSFSGNILAMASISLNNGANVAGRTLARTGAVTLINNDIDLSMCTIAPCPPITILPATLPPGAVGVAYYQTITGSGGTAPYTFAVIAGTLPAGLTLATDGVLSGTPTTAQSYTFTVQGTDANGCFNERTYTLTISGVVPTMSQWLVLFLALVLSGFGYLRLRRRQTM